MTDPIIKRGTMRSAVGIQVDEMGVTLLCNADSTIQGMPAAQFCAQGGFDGARLEITREFSAGWDSEACGSLNIFTGRVADMTITGTEVEMNIVSDLELLNVQLPRNVYQAQCLHVLYDQGCGLVASAFEVTGNTTANSSRTAIHSNLSTGNFALGTIKFTSGQNVGEMRTVRSFANGTVTTMFPFPFVPAPGDLFVAKPGCDRTLATCATFNNTGNYRGYPFIPVAEAVT